MNNVVAVPEDIQNLMIYPTHQHSPKNVVSLGLENTLHQMIQTLSDPKEWKSFVRILA